MTFIPWIQADDYFLVKSPWYELESDVIRWGSGIKDAWIGLLAVIFVIANGVLTVRLLRSPVAPTSMRYVLPGATAATRLLFIEAWAMLEMEKEFGGQFAVSLTVWGILGIVLSLVVFCGAWLQVRLVRRDMLGQQTEH